MHLLAVIDPSDLVILVGVVITAAFTLWAAVLTARTNGQRDLIAGLREEVKDNEKRITRLERRDRTWSDYANQLRKHINDGNPPPPPDFPDDLDL